MRDIYAPRRVRTAGTKRAAYRAPASVALALAAASLFPGQSSASEVWLAGADANSIGVFDASTTALVRQIPIGRNAEDVDFSRDGWTAFATSYSGGKILVINAATGQLRSEIDFGSPTVSTDMQVELRPNSSRLYVGNCGGRKELLLLDGDSASPVDLDSAAPGVQGIALPAAPWSMAFSPDGRFVYATSCSNEFQGLMKIDLQSNVLARAIPAGGFPNSVAVSDDGTLAVTAGGPTSIVDLLTDTVVAELPGSADGVAIDKARNRAFSLMRSAFDAELLTLNISDPPNTTVSSSTPLSDPSRPGGSVGQSLRRIGDFLYATLYATAGTSNSEIVVLDVSVDPPRLVRRVSFGSSAFGQVVARPADKIPPVVSIVAPLQNARYQLRQTVAANYSCADPGTVVQCTGSVPVGAAIDTSRLGANTFVVNAADSAGNVSSVLVNYTVEAGPSGRPTPPPRPR